MGRPRKLRSLLRRRHVQALLSDEEYLQVLEKSGSLTVSDYIRGLILADLGVNDTPDSPSISAMNDEIAREDELKQKAEIIEERKSDARTKKALEKKTVPIDRSKLHDLRTLEFFKLDFQDGIILPNWMIHHANEFVMSVVGHSPTDFMKKAAPEWATHVAIIALDP